MATQEIERIESVSAAAGEITHEAIINDESKLLAGFGVGDVSYQGDLMIVGISRLPASAKLRENRQLAEGNTQGSRHVLARGEVFDADSAEVAALISEATNVVVDRRYIGPVFRAPAHASADDLAHPEHGNQGFPAGQLCAVVHQRNLDAEEREQRVAD